MENCRILIADDDLETIDLIEMTLGMDKYEIVKSYDGASVLKKAKEIKPDLILLDGDMPNLTGFEVCAKLKKDHSTRYIPVIIITGTRTKIYDKIIGLQIGADDYMIKPFDPSELRVRVAQAIYRTREFIALNPLTKLPGTTRIEEEINRRIDAKEPFAVCYADLDHFKAYNDYYGYKKGDNVIHLLHEVILEGINFCGTPEDFIGHIGGDDFIVVTAVDKVDAVCDYLTKNFDQRIPAHYAKQERDRGYIVAVDRQKHERQFPVMTVSIGVGTNEKREMTCYAEVIDILIEMKKYAKTLEEKEGSVFVKDKRTSHTKVF
jgi:diguanylate cyclase (GGDEF)-like protein